MSNDRNVCAKIKKTCKYETFVNSMSAFLRWPYSATNNIQSVPLKNYVESRFWHSSCEIFHPSLIMFIIIQFCYLATRAWHVRKQETLFPESTPQWFNLDIYLCLVILFYKIYSFVPNSLVLPSQYLYPKQTQPLYQYSVTCVRKIWSMSKRKAVFLFNSWSGGEGLIQAQHSLRDITNTFHVITCFMCYVHYVSWYSWLTAFLLIELRCSSG